jgi:cell shape-determining protein MreC
MSEEPKKEKRGGAGRGQGAKLKHGEPTKTIRLPISLVDKINQGLIDFTALSKAKYIDTVTESNNSALLSEIETLKLERNQWKSKALTFESELNNENRGIKQELERTKQENIKLCRENAKLKSKAQK